jgi:hypothetical protein
VGNFVTVLKLWGFSHCLKTKRESLSVPVALVANRSVILSVESFPQLRWSPWISVSAGGSVKNSPFSAEF